MALNSGDPVAHCENIVSRDSLPKQNKVCWGNELKFFSIVYAASSLQTLFHNTT